MPRSKGPKPVVVRVQRPLTPAERDQVKDAWDQTEARKDEIIAGARKRLAARRAERAALKDVVALLKAERERRGISLADVRDRAGIDRSSLSRLENGTESNPTLATVCRLAEALGVKVEIRLVEVAEPVEAAS